MLTYEQESEGAQPFHTRNQRAGLSCIVLGAGVPGRKLARAANNRTEACRAAQCPGCHLHFGDLSCPQKLTEEAPTRELSMLLSPISTRTIAGPVEGLQDIRVDSPCTCNHTHGICGSLCVRAHACMCVGCVCGGGPATEFPKPYLPFLPGCFTVTSVRPETSSASLYQA